MTIGDFPKDYNAQIQTDWRDAYLQKQIEVNELRKRIEELQTPPLEKFKGVLPEDTHRLWRAINGYDIDDFDKRAEAFTYSVLDGTMVCESNRATIKSALAENFEQLAKDREAATVERCAKFAEDYFEMEYEKGHGEMIADAMREELLKDKS